MIVTTFGTPKSHNLSVDGQVYGPYPTEIHIAELAKKLGINFSLMEYKVIPTKVDNTYYCSWEKVSP